MTSLNPKNILFLGTHGQNNIGDEMLMETFLIQLGDKHQYTVNSYNPEFTKVKFADNFDLIIFHTLEDLFHLPSLILRSHIVVFGGGSILKELYSGVNRNRFSTLLMVLAIVSFAKIIGRKQVLMSSIGIGPIKTKFGIFLAKQILSMVDFVSVRDKKSYNICQSLKIHVNKLALVPDAIFVNDANYFDQLKKTPSNNSSFLNIALNLNYSIEHPEIWPSFIQYLAQGFRRFHTLQPIRIHGVPMQSGFKDHDDYQLLKDFRDMVPEIEIILHKPNSAKDIGHILSQCDLVVSERLHTCIIAVILGKPTLPLIYDIKIKEFTNLLSLEDFGLVIDKSFTSANFEKNLTQLELRADEISRNLLDITTRLRKQSKDNFNQLKNLVEKSD